MKVLVTGSAGFVGAETARRLLADGHRVVGVDAMTDYYDVGLKRARLERFRHDAAYSHHEFDLAEPGRLARLFAEERPDRVVHLAAQAGVSNPYLSQIERGLRKPSAEVLQQIAKALRISAEQLYIRAGIVSPSEGGAGSVELAIIGDIGLTERQKQSLLDVYSSFIASNAAERDEDDETIHPADTTQES